MKKHFNKLFLLFLILLTFENTYALTLNIDQATTLYIIFGIFIIIGIIMIVTGRIGNKGNTRSYENEKDKNDHEIEGLINRDKIDRSFSPDSIFKEIPTFSNKKFYEDINKEIEKKLKKEMPEILNIENTNNKITNFETNENKYIITSEFKCKLKVKILEEEIEKFEEITYQIISEKNKEIKTTNINLTKCPTCGAKLKDNTKNKCLKCGNKIEKQKIQKNDWKIKEIKKMDK